MQSTHIDIPERTSSKHVLEQKRLHLKESRSDLKRKLTATSFESSPVLYPKLKIEDLEVEVEEQKLHKSWLDIEYTEGNVTGGIHRSSHRATNNRIISLGEELWDQIRGLKADEEKAGKAPVLGPDVEVAFKYTLLALYKDPNLSSKRSTRVQAEMRKSAIQMYDAEKDAPKGKLWCPISQDYFETHYMKTAHIVPRRLGPSVVDYIFGSGTGSRLDTSDNCLFIHTSVERNFDNGNFVLLPADPTESPIKTWRVQLTNLAAKNSDMGRKFLADFDGQNVIFKNDNRPAARFLYFHFIITLLRNKRDRQPGWEKFCVELPTKKPFATPGRYLRQSMLLTLAKCAGDLDADRDASLLGEVGQETFEDKEQLEEKEESEIGRRAMVVYGGGDEEEEGDDGEGDEELW
jgi:hypothetical protein